MNFTFQPAIPSYSARYLHLRIEVGNEQRNKNSVQKLMLSPTSFWDFFDTVQWSRLSGRAHILIQF